MRYSGLTGACINAVSVNNLVAQAHSGVSVTDRVQRYAFETTWSNGEVVQRGTGANDGVAGFLRPGFTYTKIVDYLYGRSAEHHEIGADEVLLSRDWKFKFVSSLVPRGLENDELFRQAFIREVNAVIRKKFEVEVKAASGIDRLPQSVERAVDAKMNEVASYWNEGDEHAGIGSVGDDLVNNIGALLVPVVIAFRQTMDYGIEVASANARISSELVKQPKPVDSVFDDFAVESQNFANALTQSAAFSAAAIALNNLPSGVVGNVFSGLLGAWNILVAFGSGTNVARDKNRNEEMRREVVKTKYPLLLRAVFQLMSNDQRAAVGIENDPYLNRHGVGGAAEKFLADAHYYDQEPASIQKFQESYSAFRASYNNPNAVLVFTRKVVEEFIAADFHENSYVQESLVGVYKALLALLQMRQSTSGKSVAGASAVFQKLLEFEGALEQSVELSHIRFGFLRSRPLYQTSLPVTIQYILGRLLGPTVANRTRGILRDVKALDRASGSQQVLRRPLRDLTELHYATQESQIGSMIFLSLFIVFCFSIVFSVFRLLEVIMGAAGTVPVAICTVINYVGVAALGTVLGATLAFFHFVRKIGHLIVLHCRMRPFSSQREVRRVRLVTQTQVFLTFMRLLSVLLAMVSLGWSVFNTFADENQSCGSAAGTDGSAAGTDDTFIQALMDDYPAGLAALAFLTAVAATILFFLIELLVRYNLNTRLGQFVSSISFVLIRFPNLYVCCHRFASRSTTKLKKSRPRLPYKSMKLRWRMMTS
jgi:hypothetical protein